jgi:hypothetical protein
LYWYIYCYGVKIFKLEAIAERECIDSSLSLL